jgi:hypothetical protein
MKAFLIIMLLIGAAFGIPAIRNRIAGPLDPLLSKLGPIGEMVQTPTRRWTANQEAMAIAHKLTSDRANLNKPYPPPPQFYNWLKKNMRGLKNDGLDPWGNPYYFIHTRTEMTVGSHAQDGVRDTPDDVRFITPL